ncbi:hypothetical protein ACERZ8_13110 [Tateyamaria armeniaca]|uniref:Uncharacterized protein n=1 Tax=Tateyamaria armeniaca TaxID=2518930 RepID=A0ABW8UVL8_9RHOB
MGIKSDVQAAIATFEKENPKLKGKAYLTSGSRTWQDQLDIILQPKRAKNYKNIKARFLAKFSLKELPKKRGDLTKDQLAWWKKAIMAQAGKSPGFPHVGGKAQDVSVKNLSNDDKKKLSAIMKKAGIKILFEQVSGSTSNYGVSITKANVFHCYK